MALETPAAQPEQATRDDAKRAAVERAMRDIIAIREQILADRGGVPFTDEEMEDLWYNDYPDASCRES